MRPPARISRAIPAVLAAAILSMVAGGQPARGQSPGVMPQKPRPSQPGKDAGKKAAVPAGPVRVAATAWSRSTYEFEGRLEHGINNVTFEAPPAYQQSFTFWSNRMKGSQRTELIQTLTTTSDPAADGTLPFRRQVARYEVDMMEGGGVQAAGQPVTRAVRKLVWEGAFDASGNVASIKQVAGPEDPKSIENLSFPLLDEVFPRLGEPREMKVGDSFTETLRLPLPSHLTIRGLEKTAILRTRVFTLREVQGREAVFDVAISDAADPATPPTEPRTTCTIKGGGEGEARLSLDDGMFTSARMPSKITIDIEAPLRPLPGQPEGQDPGTAKSHIEMSLMLSGRRTLARLFDNSAPLARAGGGSGTPGSPGP
jgi:hypothetical protein